MLLSRLLRAWVGFGLSPSGKDPLTQGRRDPVIAADGSRFCVASASSCPAKNLRMEALHGNHRQRSFLGARAAFAVARLDHRRPGRTGEFGVALSAGCQSGYRVR